MYPCLRSFVWLCWICSQQICELVLWVFVSYCEYASKIPLWWKYEGWIHQYWMFQGHNWWAVMIRDGWIRLVYHFTETLWKTDVPFTAYSQTELLSADILITTVSRSQCSQSVRWRNLFSLPPSLHDKGHL